MLKLIVTTSIVLISVILFHAALFPIQSPDIESSYFAAILDKDHLLEEHDPGSILLVGGSSVAFGIDSHLISDVTGRPTYNIGLHAGLGLRFMLNNVESYVKQGDLVVLNLEYYHYVEPPSGRESDTLRRIVDVNPDYFRYITSFEQWLALLSHHPEYTSDMLFNRIINPTVFRICPGIVYCRDSFNEVGDISPSFKISNSQTMESLQNLILDADIDLIVNDINSSAIDLLNEFAAHVTQRGALLVILAPPLPQSLTESFADDQQQMMVEVANQVDIPVLNEPLSYPDDMFYDTIYHLNVAGTAEYTSFIAALLRDYLESIDVGHTHSN